MWRRSTLNYINAPSAIGKGWKEDFSIEWVKRAFPEEMESLILNYESDIENPEESLLENTFETDSDSD